MLSKFSLFKTSYSIFFFIFITCSEILSQDYVSDTLAVRAILDSNGLYTTSVKWVSDSSGGRIVKLDLFARDLNCIPTEIGNLTALLNIRLDSNNVTSIPPEIGNLVNLREFKLWNNDITSLPSEIGNLSNLTRLLLSMNSLSSIPTEIEYLNNLETLALDGNNLSSIPSQIGNLTNLEYILLSENNLTSIPPEIGNITSLVLLYISSNNLKSIPPEIGNIASLSRLNLSRNDLTTLPSSFVNLMPSSDELDLGYNKLNPNKLPVGIVAWADEFDPDWRDTQDTITAITLNQNTGSSGLLISAKNSSILFNLLKSGNVKLHIYNIKGRLLSTLVDSYKQAGSYKVNWDSKIFGSGVYFFKLSINGSAVSKKFTIIK